MITRVFRYAFAQARARTMKGQLLSADDWHYLRKMQTIDDLLRYLSGSAYAAALSRFAGAPPPEPRLLTLALYDDLFSSYAKLLRAVPSRAARLLECYLKAYEAENIKTILRGLRHRTAVGFLLYRMGSLSRLPMGALLQAGEVEAVVELLKPTCFHAPLRQAMAQFHSTGRLFPLEVSIDRAVLENGSATLQRIGAADRRAVEQLVGKTIDLVNLAWLVRFRHLYGIGPEEAINYTVPGGRQLTVQRLGAIARAADLPAFLAALPEAYRKALSPAERWSQIPELLRRFYVLELERHFRFDPFRLSLPLSLLRLKEIEVKALEGLIAAIGREHLPAGAEEGGRV